MLLSIFLLIAGFFLLIKGANYTVEGASEAAERFGVPTIVVGLTIVAFGTSAPEIVVNLIAALSGSPEIAMGNINGTVIANTLLILGLTALFIRIPVKSRTVAKEIPFMVLAGVLLFVLVLDQLLDGAASPILSRIDGIVMILVFLVFLYYLFLSTQGIPMETKSRKGSLWRPIGFTLGGVTALVIGGKLAVDGAVGFATGIGISESLVSLTIVAVGTSLPELVASVVAARKGKTDLAIGGIVGSNIFDILLGLGSSAILAPMVLDTSMIIDVGLVVIVLSILLFAVFIGGNEKDGRSRGLNRRTGFVFLALYAIYIVYIVMRG